MCTYVLIVETDSGYEVKTFENEKSYLSFLSDSRAEGIPITRIFMITSGNNSVVSWIVEVCNDFLEGEIDLESLDEKLQNFSII